MRIVFDLDGQKIEACGYTDSAIVSISIDGKRRDDIAGHCDWDDCCSPVNCLAIEQWPDVTGMAFNRWISQLADEMFGRGYELTGTECDAVIAEARRRSRMADVPDGCMAVWQEEKA
jgi:hypothetical protein